MLLIKRLNQMMWMNSLVFSFRTWSQWTVQTQLWKAIFCTGMLSTVPQLFRWLCLLCTVGNLSFEKTTLLTRSKILQNTREVFQSTEWRRLKAISCFSWKVSEPRFIPCAGEGLFSYWRPLWLTARLSDIGCHSTSISKASAISLNPQNNSAINK